MWAQPWTTYSCHCLEGLEHCRRGQKYVIAGRQGEGYKIPFLRLDTFITINLSYLAHTEPVQEEVASKNPALHKALPCLLNPPFYKIHYNKSQSESKKQNSKTSVGPWWPRVRDTSNMRTAPIGSFPTPNLAPWIRLPNINPSRIYYCQLFICLTFIKCCPPSPVLQPLRM